MARRALGWYGRRNGWTASASPGARKYAAVPSASVQTRTPSSGHQRAASRQPGMFTTGLTSKGAPGTPANGSR
jgi:hypothetical protein